LFVINLQLLVARSLKKFSDEETQPKTTISTFKNISYKFKQEKITKQKSANKIQKAVKNY